MAYPLKTTTYGITTYGINAWKPFMLFIHYSSLEAELEKVKRDHSILAKDVEHSHAAAVAATKRSKDAEAHAKSAEARLLQVDEEFLSDCPQLAGMYNEFKKEWPAEYFEGLFVDSRLGETPAKNGEVAAEGDEVAGKEVAVEYGDEATP
ncbi:hypothetical protein LIER_35861 [Lithospermum erythrorhizon]|uniref:Uncharacterized protein n=1 Tax=Lithospermum erythrorhizon TaxID=34254 RepID=A0AAV3NXA3_LITER